MAKITLLGRARRRRKSRRALSGALPPSCYTKKGKRKKRKGMKKSLRSRCFAR